MKFIAIVETTMSDYWRHMCVHAKRLGPFLTSNDSLDWPIIFLDASFPCTFHGHFRGINRI